MPAYPMAAESPMWYFRATFNDLDTRLVRLTMQFNVNVHDDNRNADGGAIWRKVENKS